MKRFLLTAVFVLTGALAFSQERIAVFPFEDRNNVYTKDELDSFYAEFSNEFRNKTDDRRFTVLTRNDLEKIINMEAKFQLSDYSSKEKTAEMQRVLNAQQVLYCLILKVDNEIRITVSRYTFPELSVLRGGKTINVTNKNQLFGKIPELVQAMVDEIAGGGIVPGGNEDSDGRPGWINIPLNGRVKFETAGTGVSNWYYEVGLSNKTATEQLARQRATENVRQMIAANIASEMKSRIDITSQSLFMSSDIEETETRIVASITNSIRTRVPTPEVLEWYIEKGSENGRNYFIAYVLVRFIRQDILKDVEAMNMQNVADTVIRNLKISATESEKAALVHELEAARDVSLRIIRNGSGGR
jgi:hypothetical protein